MLLKEEEIKSHLRLDDGLYSDGDFLKLLAQAVQKKNRDIPEQEVVCTGRDDSGR